MADGSIEKEQQKDVYGVSMRFEVRAVSGAEAETQVINFLASSPDYIEESIEYGIEDFEGTSWLIEKVRHLKVVKNAESVEPI